MRDRNRGVWLLLFIFLFSASSLACEWDYFIWIPRSPTADPLYRFLKGGKAGYIDRTGKVVIGPILSNFGGNYGGEFHNGLLDIGVSDGVYVDKSGKKVIDLGLYRGWDFSEGLAAAVKEDNGKWEYMTQKGNRPIPPRFGWSQTDYVSSFEGGFAAIEVSGKYGYINHTGEFVIPPHFLLGSSFSEGFAQVVLDGPCFYSDQTSPCSSPISLPRGMKTSESLPACKLAFIDTKGRVISENRFEGAKPFSEGMAPVRVENTWGFIDTKGNLSNSAQIREGRRFFRRTGAGICERKVRLHRPTRFICH